MANPYDVGLCARAIRASTKGQGPFGLRAPTPPAPPDMVLLDNLRAHKTPAVQRLIERREATAQLLRF